MTRAQRSLSPQARRLMARQAAKAEPLASVPLPPSPYLRPLAFTEAEVPVFRLSAEPIYSEVPDDAYATHGHRASYCLHGNRANDRAAMRDHLLQAHEWGGEEVRVAALLQTSAGTTRVILEGTWAAIRRALPDREAVRTWKEAGAVEYPLWDFTRPGPVRRVVWVAIDHVPVVLRMEVADRGRAPLGP